ILATAPNRQGELIVGHNDFDPRGILVKHDLDNFGRLQRVDDEGGGIRRPWNDIDLLALQFIDDRLHPRSAHADAGADRIDRSIPRNHRDLGARPRIARDRLHLDDIIVDFRHFLAKQFCHELRMRARQKNLRPTLFAANVIDIGAGAVAWPENFTRDHFVTPYRRLAASEIDDHIAKFHPLHDAVDDIADPALVLLILPVALGFADLLYDHLLGRLRGDPPEIERGQGFRDPIAGLRRRVFLARLVDRDLSGVVLDLIDD